MATTWNDPEPISYIALNKWKSDNILAWPKGSPMPGVVRFSQPLDVRKSTSGIVKARVELILAGITAAKSKHFVLHLNVLSYNNIPSIG